MTERQRQRQELSAEPPTWPGFDPDQVPLALYDGEQTVLIGHPDPPEEFVDGVYPGLHPEVRANTNIDIGGVQTATVMKVVREGDPPLDPDLLDGTIRHEKFHVFQQHSHPDWGAQEFHAFAYPTDDAAVLRSRRMEARAFHRALLDRSAAWVQTALTLRRERFANMPETAVAYERAAELHEGTAQYMEGLRRCLAGLEGTLAVDEVRPAFYRTGEALALLLDGFVPDWKERLEADDSLFLDELLVVEAAPAEFTAAERERFASDAERAVELLAERRVALREAFFATGGRTTLTASDAPFQCAGFDPMNHQLLGPGVVLHTRYLRLSGSGFGLEMLDGEAITEGPPDNPVFGGIRRAFF